MFSPKDKAVATMVYIETHPEEWVQAQWRCETGMCWAGHYANISEEVEWVNDDPHWAANIVRVKATGEKLSVRDWVLTDMGISQEDANAMFSAVNTLGMLQAATKAYVNAEPIQETIVKDLVGRNPSNLTYVERSVLREYAWEKFDGGMPVAEIARRVHRTPRTVQRWLDQ